MTDELKDLADDATPVTPKQIADASLTPRDVRFRERLNSTVAEFEQFKIASEKEKETFTSTVNNLSKEKQLIRDRYVEAEVKAAAVAAGISDPDLVKLIAKDKIAVGDDFSITGVDETIQEFKATKPHFFGTEKKTFSSTNAKMPAKEETVRVLAKDLSDEEFEAVSRRIKSGQAIQ